MATYTGQSIAEPSLSFGGLRLDPKHGRLLDGATSTTTIFYRAANGSRGSTTDPASVPSTAVVERRVTA